MGTWLPCGVRGRRAGIDCYGDVVDLRASGPAGRALIDNPADRQAAGTVPAATGIVPWVRIGGGTPRPLWSADSVAQRYRRGTNVIVTTARFEAARVRVVSPAASALTACLPEPDAGARVELRSREPEAEQRLRCDDPAPRRTVRAAARE